MALDAHDRGARYVLRKLVEAGMEVVFLRFELVDELVAAAIQEDPDVVALSILTGGHLVVVEDLAKGLEEAGLSDRLLVVGGIIPPEDFDALHALGVDGIFTPGQPVEEIVEFVRGRLAAPVT